MKNILIITTSFFPNIGGQEIGLMKLLKGISNFKEGYNLTVLTPRYSLEDAEIENFEGISVIRYNSCHIRLIWRILSKNLNLWLHIIYGFISIGKYIRKISPDFILIYFILPSGFPAMYYAKKYNIKNAVFIGGSDIFTESKILKKSVKYVLSKTNKIIGTSDFIIDEVKKKYNIEKEKSIIIPYGINLDFVKSNGSQVKDNEKINILCVQRLVKSKGTHYLISALSSIINSQNTPAYLDIVGDGEERRELEELTNKLNLSKFITFHGNVNNKNIYKYYADSDIFVFPTILEGFGIVLLEAMAFGKIIIASDCSSIPEIITNNHSGLLFNPGDVFDLANKLKMVIQDIKKYQYLGENAKKDVSKYNISVISRKLLDQLK